MVPLHPVSIPKKDLSLSEKFFSLLMLHLKRLIIYYFSGDPEASVPLYLLRGLLCVEEISSQIEHFYVSVKKINNNSKKNSRLNFSITPSLIGVWGLMAFPGFTSPPRLFSSAFVFRLFLSESAAESVLQPDV